MDRLCLLDGAELLLSRIHLDVLCSVCCRHRSVPRGTDPVYAVSVPPVLFACVGSRSLLIQKLCALYQFKRKYVSRVQASP